MTVGQALADTSLDRSDVYALLSHCLQRNKAWLIAHADAEIPAAQNGLFLALIARKKRGEPVAYLTGKKEFYGRDFFCTPATLVPRPETELLIDLALDLGDAQGKSPHILDLGTGTGCIALTLACERPEWRITATDISQEALAISKQNAQKLGCFAPQVSFLESSWFAALSNAQFDLIVCNPPYIAHDDPHLAGDGLRFEPRSALTDGHDGLDAYRTLARDAAQHLSARGALLMEHGHDQALAISTLFEAVQCWAASTLHRDLARLPRVTIARKT